jgi:hypothetical protein
LVDASSRPAKSPRSIAPAKALAIVELRHKRLTHARIAAALSVSKSTVGRVLARAGLSRLEDPQPAEPVVRYEHAAPGDLLHIDTRKLGRIERPSHRVIGFWQAFATLTCQNTSGWCLRMSPSGQNSRWYLVARWLAYSPRY